MQPLLPGHLDALAVWRQALDRQLAELTLFFSGHGLLDASVEETLGLTRQRLAADRLVLAFVAEFSRGKSELINALFFGDTGRRILPATPGRTTMCPVELGYVAGDPPLLALLPVETRLEGHSLAELRQDKERWTHVRLDPSSPQQLAEAMGEVMRTKAVTVDEARALGFWNDEEIQDNPPLITDGLVEVPAWRHAVVNYPHPLLRRGLVVLDTPGLNAVGAEPELTLALLPAAQAVVFVLGADTGVTRSDLSIWRDHLGGQSTARYVVLNKIDTLADPLLDDDAVRAQVERQRQDAANLLELPPDRVFALSARQALNARIERRPADFAASGVPALELALARELLPGRRTALGQVVFDCVDLVETQTAQRLADQRRQLTEQLLELRSLRGKSEAKLALLIERVERERSDFEPCATRLSALRAMHARMLRETLLGLATEPLHEEALQMQRDTLDTLFGLGAKKAFAALCGRLRQRLGSAHQRVEETRAMLDANYTACNTEFGFALVLAAPPSLQRYAHELDLIEKNYSQYLGLSHALRLADPRFLERFRRMLLAKLRTVFEAAAGAVERWNKSASAQIDTQLRDRRHAFKRRREALQRVRTVESELEERIADLEGRDRHQQLLLVRLKELTQALRETAAPQPETAAAATLTAAGLEPPVLTLVVPPAESRLASSGRG